MCLPVGPASVVKFCFAGCGRLISRHELTCAIEDFRFARHSALLSIQNASIAACDVLHGEVVAQSIRTLYLVAQSPVLQ